MDRGVIEAILKKYGLAYRRILQPQKGYRNQSFGVELLDGNMLNLILYKSEPGILPKIQHANNVGSFLADAGFPARRPHNERIVCLKAGARIKYGALYSYLPGRTIPWEAYTREHIKMLGGTMSDMHAALAAHNSADLPDTALESLALLQRMRAYFSDLSVTKALAAKLNLTVLRDNFESTLRLCASQPGQTLHMDFVRGNILFDGATITGILDFEKTARGLPLLDIARTLAFLLVDCKFKSEDKIRKYFLHSGYNKRGTARCLQMPGEKALLEDLLNFFLLHDLYKFLRHNPYECLPQNEHFIRTVHILRKRGIIS